MIITLDQLAEIAGKKTKMERELLERFITPLNEELPKYGIDTPVEVASFLAQVLHESGGFKWMRELWGPTSQQIRYERDFTKPWTATDPRNKLAFSLGNYVVGDGKLFMGRGPIQMTGRKNYERLSREMFGDNTLLHNPDIITTPKYGIISSCIYWKWRNLDRYDDDLSVKEETKLVNGGYNGLDDRQRYMDRAIKVFGI